MIQFSKKKKGIRRTEVGSRSRRDQRQVGRENEAQ